MQVRSFSEQSKYKEIRRLGSGSTGDVYLVSDNLDGSLRGTFDAGLTGSLYAMKVCEDKDLLHQESELLKSLKHPAFPVWKDYYEEECGHLVMEYIEGITLQQYLENHGKLTIRQAARIIMDILDALKYLHHQSTPIIFRDIKPANIMISKTGKIRLIDVGGAVASKYKVGTYGYAAPEQFWEGIQPGPECDFYAVGKLLTYLLTGKNPCEPPYDMLRFCERNKNISPEIYKVIQRSLSAESLGRYASAEEFIRELKEAAWQSGKKKWRIFPKKDQIVYEKCIWKSEYQRIF